MTEGDGQWDPKRLNLIKKGNAQDPNSDSVRLDVLIDGTGDLVMEGEDTGPSVERVWDDDEYEYFVRVSKRHKDWLLLNLVKEVFGESPSSSAFMRWLKEKKIPYESHSC
jgi:hypothetical protein